MAICYVSIRLVYQNYMYKMSVCVQAVGTEIIDRRPADRHQDPWPTQPRVPSYLAAIRSSSSIRDSNRLVSMSLADQVLFWYLPSLISNPSLIVRR